MSSLHMLAHGCGKCLQRVVNEQLYSGKCNAQPESNTATNTSTCTNLFDDSSPAAHLLHCTTNACHMSCSVLACMLVLLLFHMSPLDTQHA
jgi:hypothetical protein